MLEHSDSRAIFAEDGDQLAKIREIEDRCPELEHIVVMDAGDADIGDALSLDALRERGRGRDESEWKARYEAVTPDDICLYIYTSGTTGPPKGCILSHANYRAITDAVVADSVLEEGDSSYLFLPLAHAFAILIQFATFELGAAMAYWSRDPKMIIADITQVNPTFFPSVPRMFEKIYTLATSNIEDKEQLAPGGPGRREGADDARGGRGGPRGAPGRVRPGRGEALQERPRPVRHEHARVRDRRRADRLGDPRVLLRIRRARDGGLRDDGDLHERHGQPPGGEQLPLRLGGQAAEGRGGEDRRRRRGPDQGPEHLPGLLQERGRHEGDARGRAGSTRATWGGSTRTASSTSPAARRTSSSRQAARTSRPPTSRTA